MKTDSLLGRILRRWIPPLILLALFLGFVVQINQVDKVELISRDGQTFEKGVVTEIRTTYSQMAAGWANSASRCA